MLFLELLRKVFFIVNNDYAMFKLLNYHKQLLRNKVFFERGSSIYNVNPCLFLIYHKANIVVILSAENKF